MCVARLRKTPSPVVLNERVVVVTRSEGLRMERGGTRNRCISNCNIRTDFSFWHHSDNNSSSTEGKFCDESSSTLHDGQGKERESSDKATAVNLPTGKLTFERMTPSSVTTPHSA